MVTFLGGYSLQQTIPLGIPEAFEPVVPDDFKNVIGSGVSVFYKGSSSGVTWTILDLQSANHWIFEVEKTSEPFQDATHYMLLLSSRCSSIVRHCRLFRNSQMKKNLAKQATTNRMWERQVLFE